MFKIELEDLNVISAGAGSGKTFTVQETLSTWLKEHPDKIHPHKILAVTFTKMAAHEMQSRIRAALLNSGNLDAAMKVSSAQISTIHSFGQDIIQSFSYEAGMSPKVRQLSEAEEKILLQLTLSSHSQINSILEKLETLGYTMTRGGDGEFKTPLQQLQSRVMQIINTMRTIGATDSKAQTYIDLLTKEIKLYYGDLEVASSLNNNLHNAVKALIASYPHNMKDIVLQPDEVNAAAEKAFTANFRALNKALNIENIESDWALWSLLQSLRTTKVKDDTYLVLAKEVMLAAKKLSSHPGPLEEAISHVSTILQISIDTLHDYNEEKRKNALIDFSDMVHIANSIMDEDAYIKEMAETYDCLVIDEFQDTNPIQFGLLWKFRQAGLPTLIVGDLKQSIMGFQGADASLFESLIGLDAATTNKLESNWRSTPALMEWINAMGKGLYGEQYTHLTPQATYQSHLNPLEIIDFYDDGWSANGTKVKKSFSQKQHVVISQHIKKLIASKQTIYDRHTKQTRDIEPSDIAILAPSHSMLGKAASSLRKQGLEAQIKQNGWFESRIVQIAFHALSYLSNAADKHAALYLIVTELGDISLEDALNMYLSDKKFTHHLIDQLDSVRQETYTLTLSRQLIDMIESLNLWDYVIKHDDSSQQRANLLKLIDLCAEFESLQFESLNALGIYGRNLNSFLSWLSLNESDSQPTPKSINNEAVQLLTWHASKGLEWPVVIVMGLDNNKAPSLPDISLGYTDDSRDDPLDNTYIKFFPQFQDDTTNDNFIETLNNDAHNTVRNLLYVAMTRAREQLILPWPSFKEGKEGEFSFMHKLMHSCGMQVSEENITMNYLTRDAGFKESISLATYIEDSDTLAKTLPITYGRVAIKKMSESQKIPAQMSPSGLEKSKSIFDVAKLSLLTYGPTVDLSGIKMDAADLGTLLHHSYHVLLADSTLKVRLFASMEDKISVDVLQQIEAQVGDFDLYSKDELKVINTQGEVSILSKSDEGSVVSGSIDLLLETEEGYWIIDHKSDRVSDFGMKFTHHYPQLEAYARFIHLDKPLLGVGINWVRYGKMSVLIYS